MRPDSVGVLRSLGIALFEHSKLTQEEAARLKPEEVLADYAANSVPFHRGRLAEAEAYCRQAIRLQANFPGGAQQPWTDAVHQGRLPEAEAAYREAIRLKPDYAIAYDNLGVVLKDTRKYAEAAEKSREAIRLPPRFASAHNHLGLALKHLRQYAAAEESCRTALAIKPDFANAHFNLGMILYSQLKWADAEATLRRAFKLDPTLREMDGVAEVMASALLRQKKLEAAAAEYRRAIRRNPTSALVRYNLGNVLDGLDRSAEAETEYREAVRLKPDYAEAHCNLGLVLQRQGKFVEALAELRCGHELGSKRPGWKHASEKWVAECQQQTALDARLPAFLEGREQPANAAESVELARLCREPHGRMAASARFYAAAFAADPKVADDLGRHHRYNAACAAIQAGTGGGVDAGSLSNDERARWRRQAIDWLRAELAARAKRLQSNQPKERTSTQEMLRHWQDDADLKRIREPVVQASTGRRTRSLEKALGGTRRRTRDVGPLVVCYRSIVAAGLRTCRVVPPAGSETCRHRSGAMNH